MGSPRRRLRLSQASAISVAILASAVLALGVVLYGYFSSQAAQAMREQGLVDTYTLYSSSVYTRLEAAYGGEAPDGSGTLLGCYVVTLHNRGGSDLRVYLTVLPARQAQWGLSLEPEVYRIPLDYASLSLGVPTPPQRVYLYRVADIDSDGVSDVVGSGGRLRGDPYFPSCPSIYSNQTAKNVSLQPELVDPAAVQATLEGPGLDTLLRQAGASQVDRVPLWSFTVPAGGSVTLFIYVEMPSKPGALAVAEFFSVAPNYYLFSVAQLPVDTSG